MTLLAAPIEENLEAIIEKEEVDYAAPVHQDRVFLIMWQSARSGGTYTELRKSVQGKNRFLSALHFMGIDMRSVQVFEQQKVWVPEPKGRKKQRGNAARR